MGLRQCIVLRIAIEMPSFFFGTFYCFCRKMKKNEEKCKKMQKNARKMQKNVRKLAPENCDFQSKTVISVAIESTHRSPNAIPVAISVPANTNTNTTHSQRNQSSSGMYCSLHNLFNSVVVRSVVCALTLAGHRRACCVRREVKQAETHEQSIRDLPEIKLWRSDMGIDARGFFLTRRTACHPVAMKNSENK